MRPEQAFVGKPVVKILGHNKGARGIIERESDMLSGMIFIKLQGETETRAYNPQEWAGTPKEETPASTDEIK